MLFRKASTLKTAQIYITVCLTLLLGLSLAGSASAQIRIVIAPFYVEEGMDAGAQKQKERIAKASEEKKETDTPQQIDNIIEVRLEGVTEYTLSEVFAKVINAAAGVVEAKRMASSIVPNNRHVSWVVWRVKIEDTDSLRLQTNILKMIHDILDAGVTIHYKGIPYRYTPEDLALLKGIRPGDSTSQKIQFVIDRDLARDKEHRKSIVPISPKSQADGKKTSHLKPKDRAQDSPKRKNLASRKPESRRPELKPCEDQSLEISVLKNDVKNELKKLDMKSSRLDFTFCGQIYDPVYEEIKEDNKTKFICTYRYEIRIIYKDKSKIEQYIQYVASSWAYDDHKLAENNAWDTMVDYFVKILDEIPDSEEKSFNSALFESIDRKIVTSIIETDRIRKMVEAIGIAMERKGGRNSEADIL